jgi:hypothetical protein
MQGLVHRSPSECTFIDTVASELRCVSKSLEASSVLSNNLAIRTVRLLRFEYGFCKSGNKLDRYQKLKQNAIMVRGATNTLDERIS